MQAVLIFCWRLVVDFAGVLVGWTSLDVAWDWLMGEPIAQYGSMRYLAPTIAAAITAALARYARPSAAETPPPPSVGWRAALGLDWADTLALLAAYEVARRLLPILSPIDPLPLRVAITVVGAVALGLATAYLVHWLLQHLRTRLDRSAAPVLKAAANTAQRPPPRASGAPAPPSRTRQALRSPSRTRR